ncbi:MAG TPA: hypothetical protein VJZ70_05495, partial [Limnochordia bacterium]|nr:hypothetical protein [Limnochordia bacterium]
MWRRLIRSRGFVLLIFAVIFSFGILGQVDTRMHIGGSDWDLDSLIYINVDDYILEELVSQDTVNVQVDQEQTLEPPSKMHAQVSLDEVAEVTSKASTEAPVEVALLEAADSAEET